VREGVLGTREWTCVPIEVAGSIVHVRIADLECMCAVCYVGVVWDEGAGIQRMLSPVCPGCSKRHQHPVSWPGYALYVSTVWMSPASTFMRAAARGTSLLVHSMLLVLALIVAWSWLGADGGCCGGVGRICCMVAVGSCDVDCGGVEHEVHLRIICVTTSAVVRRCGTLPPGGAKDGVFWKLVCAENPKGWPTWGHGVSCKPQQVLHLPWGGMRLFDTCVELWG
jgi:hypothetical protein